jgi:glutathionylspermidine synthase
VVKKASQGVKSPWRAGPLLSRTDWEQYCEQLAAESAKSGIPTQDYYLPADFPLVLDEAEWRSLARIAEKLTAEALEAERELVRRTDLHAKLGVPESIREVLREGAGEEAPVEAGRYMRFDFHWTREGWRISEVNADTLGGFNVASLFTELMAPYYPKWETPPDPVRALAKGVRAIVERGELVGIIRRTVHERDCEAKYLARELRRQGMRAVIASPGEVRWEAGRASIESAMGSGRPSMLIRFLDAEWLPKLRPGSEWKKWFAGSRTPMSNPGTSILITSKRFPLVWEELETEVPTWRAMIPETRSPSELGGTAGRGWVLKSVYGRVGREVAIAGISSGRGYREAARKAKKNPEGWVAQRRFEMQAVETERGKRHVCLGIYTVDGKAAGAYARMSKTALVDQNAQDVAVLLRGGK